MSNLLVVLPTLPPYDYYYSCARILSIWSNDVLGRSIPIGSIPFLSIDDANRILDRIEKSCCGLTHNTDQSTDKNKMWLDAARKALNSKE